MSEHIDRLALKFKAGDAEAFGEIYDLLFDKIYRFIYFKTYHKETAEDITSRTFLKALGGINGFNPNKARFTTWIYRIARNAVIDYYRTRKKNSDIDDIWDIKDPSDMVLDLETKEYIAKLHTALNTLSPDVREIIILRIWEGMSYREIAGIVGKSEAGCKMAFSRAVKELRGKIAIVVAVLTVLVSRIG
jgi:RNA polymerase sigma-70 factor (ECF subfamily)